MCRLGRSRKDYTQSGEMGCGVSTKGRCEPSRAQIVFMEEASVNMEYKSLWLAVLQCLLQLSF